MHLPELYLSAVIALAVAAISTTTARSGIFYPVRKYIDGKNKTLGELAACSYCTSHWLSFALVAVYRPRLLVQYYLLDLIVTAFAIIAMSAIFIGIIGSLIRFRPDEAREMDEEQAKDEDNFDNFREEEP